MHDLIWAPAFGRRGFVLGRLRQLWARRTWRTVRLPPCKETAPRTYAREAIKDAEDVIRVARSVLR